MHRLAPAILLGGVLLFATGAEAPASPEPTPAPRSDGRDRDQANQVMATVSAEVAKLKARAEQVPAVPRVDRDPFRFGRGREPAPPPPSQPVVDLAPAPEPVELPKLVALLEATTDAGVDRSASVALDGDVRLARTGDTIGRFTIQSIESDAVVLIDSVTAAVHRITLR